MLATSTTPTNAPLRALRHSATARGAALLLALAVPLLAGGCSSDDPESGASTVNPDAPSGIVFASTDDACVTSGGDRLLWGEMTVDEPLTATGAQLVNPMKGAQQRAAWYTTPSSGGELTGSSEGAVPPAEVRDDLGWADRAPLEDAELEPGTTYVFLISLDLPTNGTFSAIDFYWRTDVGGNNRYPVTVSSKACP